MKQLFYTALLAPGMGLIGCGHTGGNTATPAAPPKITNRVHLSPMAWTSGAWQKSCAGIRTSYNPDTDLTDDTLTLVPGKSRWLDFVYWTLNNKVAEHQVEQYGGTGWDGPEGGVVFHWAPGSHWERDTLASFGFTIGHVIGEHRWTDTMFPDFFEPHGGVYGINVKDRLTEIDPGSPVIWVKFLEHIGGASSPYYRYLFHQEAVVDPKEASIHLLGGQGVAFTYSFERYYHELREVLTDCRAVDFFKMYDQFGHGFASEGNWAKQNPPPASVTKAGYNHATYTPKKIYEPNPPAVEVPDTIREADAMKRGKDIYLAQCAVCHGVQGDGNGFLAAGFQVKPRDFTKAQYKFRSTRVDNLPTIEDLAKVIKEGVPNSTMPAWGQFLKPEQISDVAKYLVLFSSEFKEAWQQGATPEKLALPPAPANIDGLAGQGARVYKKLQCAKCHGSSGKGDGRSAKGLKDSDGHPIETTDLTNKWSFKNGYKATDLYRTFLSGLTGTPMPSYEGAFKKPEDAWALTSYVLSLSPTERPVMHLDAFATERKHRIGPRGRVMPKK